MSGENWFVLVLILIPVGMIALAIWGANDPTQQAIQKAKSDEIRQDVAHRSRGLIRHDSGPPSCPKCGGVQFKLRRSSNRRAGIVTAGALTGGIGALAAAGKQKVQCVTCGLFYDTL